MHAYSPTPAQARTHIVFHLILASWIVASAAITTAVAQSPTTVEIDAPRPRPFLSPQLWPNGFEHWSADGDTVYATTGNNLRLRTAHLLTARLDPDLGDRATASVMLNTAPDSRAGLQGLLFAAGENLLDPRAASLIQGTPGQGGGFLAYLDHDANTLVIADFGSHDTWWSGENLAQAPIDRDLPDGPLELTLILQIDGPQARVQASLSSANGASLATTQTTVPAERVAGNIALASDFLNEPADGKRHGFSKFTIDGPMWLHDPDRAFGPLAGALYSLSHPRPDADPLLRISVQALPLGPTFRMGQPRRDSQQARVTLASRPLGSDQPYEPLGHPAAILGPSYHALFQFDDWPADRGHDIRVTLTTPDGLTDELFLEVHAEPDDDQPLRVAGVSCMGLNGRGVIGVDDPQPGLELVSRWTPANIWFPFAGVVDRLAQLEPDYVFYTGDQIYEGKPYPPPQPDQDLVLDYHYRFALWHRAFGDINRTTNTVLQTDDHDVYQGNIWGDGGRQLTEGWFWQGGYLRPAEDVNLVLRTMCSHNPPPWPAPDPPSGIRNYFTTFRYAGNDFAVLEDRKFKAAGSPQARQAPDDQLLGPEQLDMLDDLAAWPGDRPRVVVSQTIYASIQTNPATGEMRPERDTNGWPVAGRNRALNAFAKANALLLTGDQHLGTLARLPAPDATGSVYQFCTPAVGTVYWRWFAPDNQQHPRGQYQDAHGNPFEILAVANPMPVEFMPVMGNNFPNQLPPEHLDADRRGNRGDGVGTVQLNPADRSVTFECWPWNGSDTQHEGWPHTVGFDQIIGR